MNNVQLTDNQHPTNTSADFFDELQSWLTSPTLAFSSWISALPLAASTKKVKLSMWNKFTRWLTERELGLADCQANHVQAFIKASKLEKEHAWRYVKLIERVYFHLSVLGLRIPNPGQQTGKKGVGNRRNDPMRILDREEREKIEKHLFEFFDYVGSSAAVEAWREEQKKDKKAQRWAEVRDAAITAVVVGAGVKVGEVAGLSVNCTSNGCIVFPQTLKTPERHVPLLPIAVRALEVWALYRDSINAYGPVLFPALVSRRRKDMAVTKAIMNPSTIFRGVRDTLQQAGVTGSRAAGQTLRNTYATALIENGATNLMLIEALGLQGEFSVLHLRQEVGRAREAGQKRHLQGGGAGLD